MPDALGGNRTGRSAPSRSDPASLTEQPAHFGSEPVENRDIYDSP